MTKVVLTTSVLSGFTDLKRLQSLARLTAGSKAALLQEVGLTVAEQTRMRFLDQTAPDGTPWPISYRARAQSGETLRDTGRLMNSITYQLSGASSVDIGTNVIYADVHQYGAVIRPKTSKYLRFKVGDRWVSKTEVKVPRRAFLGLSNADKQELSDVVSNFFARLT